MSEIQYVYVDESGQVDGRGDALHVGIAVVDAALREEAQRRLESLEQRIGKRGKWHGSSVKTKSEYFKGLIQTTAGPALYWFRSIVPCAYEEATACAAARAMRLAGGPDARFIVIIDGLKKASRQRVARILREHQVRWREIQVNKREDSDSLLRLADALAGFVRDVHHRKEFALGLWPSAEGLVREVPDSPQSDGRRATNPD